MGTDSFDQLEAIHVRKMQIGDEGADIVLSQAAQSFFGGGDRSYPQIRQLHQRDLERIPAKISILHNEDGTRHKRLGQEAVPHPMHGEKVLRMAGVRFEFLPKPHHVGIYRTGIGE